MAAKSSKIASAVGSASLLTSAWQPPRHLESFNYGAQVAPFVIDSTLGRTVVQRLRHSRIIALGDRKSPICRTPALVGTKKDVDEVELSAGIMPFIVEYDSTSLPASMKVTGRGALAMPFDNDSPEWHCQMNHVLPPSLEDADSGLKSRAFGGLLAISWQAMIHDSELAELGEQPEIIALVDSLQLANHPGKLATALAVLRTRFPGALLWCPGLSGPDNLALLTWFGADLHDFTRSRQAESLGYLLTADGARKPNAEFDEDSVFSEQVVEWKRELSAVKSAITGGTLRQLVEKRSLNSPKLVEHLRFHDRMMKDELHGLNNIEIHGAPLRRFVKEGTKWRCNSAVSRQDPLIVDWINRMATEYRAPAEQSEVLVLLPCSARKPYSMSQSHRRFRRVLRHRPIHEVMVTSPLGLVPRELEELWPAGHYDIPVTGDWDGEEIEMIQKLVKSFVQNNGYKQVINHSGISLDGDEIPAEIIDTRQGEGAGSADALDRLKEASDAAAKQFHPEYRIGEKQHLLSKMRAISRWLHANDDWLAKAHVGGKPPRWKILQGKEQLAMWHPNDGRFAFAKSTLPNLSECKTLGEVHLVDGPKLEGDIFSPMVDKVVGDLREGDEVLIFRSGKLLGSARSVTSKWEYFGSPGRVAKTKHRL